MDFTITFHSEGIKEDKNDWYLIHNIHVLYTGTYTIASFIQCSDRSNIDVVI